MTFERRVKGNPRPAFSAQLDIIKSPRQNHSWSSRCNTLNLRVISNCSRLILRRGDETSRKTFRDRYGSIPAYGIDTTGYVI